MSHLVISHNSYDNSYEPFFVDLMVVVIVCCKKTVENAHINFPSL